MKRSEAATAMFAALSFFLSLAPLTYAQQSDIEKAKALNQQVVNLFRQGRYSAAVPIAINVLAIREKVLGPEHPDVATGLNNLAMLYNSLGDYAKKT